MTTRTIATKLVIEGESEYKRSVANINNSLDALKAGLNSVKAEFNKNANSMDALRAKGTALSQLHEKQAGKIKIVEQALENAKKAQQEYAAKVASAQAKVTAAENSLGKMSQTSGAAAQTQRALTEELEKYRNELAIAERNNETAQKGVNNWQKQLSGANRDLSKFNADIRANDQYMSEAKKSSDGCATSIDQYGKKVKKAKEETNGAETAVSKLASSMSKAGDQLSEAGNKLTSRVTVPLIAAGVAAVKFASDTSESANKVEVAFGSASDGVQSWADTTLTNIGLAKGTALDMAALYGDMATSMGAADDQAASMSMTLVDLAADLASFKNISIDQAETALKSIFTGETETLKNLGIVMTEANLKAYAMAEGYSKAYDEMGQLEKVQLRYNFVLANTQNAQGDFTRTFDGTANQLRVCQESLKELADTAGDELLPVITPIITQVNGLLQSFGDLDETTRANITQALLFAATLGPMLKLVGAGTTATTAAVTAYGALTAALRAKQAADVAATASQTGLNAAMTANPATAVIAVIGTLIAMLGAYAVTAALTAEKTHVLTEKFEKSRQAYADTQKALGEQRVETKATVAALEELAAVESKTNAQKETLLSLVDQLNEAVPGLNLAYDQQTDSLSMTTDQLRKYIDLLVEQEQAADIVDRLTELEIEQKTITDDLAAAQENLAAKRQAYNDAMSSGKLLNGELRELTQAQENVDALTGALEANRTESGQLTEEYGRLSSAARDAGRAAADSGAGAEAASADFSALTSVLDGARDGYELLAKAQGEMSDTGYLTLDTVQKLISSGLGGYLVEVEGGYRLANGALDNYMSAQKAAYSMALGEARTGALELINQNGSETMAIDATTEAIYRKLAALQAEARAKVNSLAQQAPSGGSMYGQSAWLENQADYKTAKADLDAYTQAIRDLDAAQKSAASFDRAASSLQRDYGGSSSSGHKGSSGGSGSSKSKTQPERDLESYKDAVDELDHLRAMDLLSEGDYYSKKGALADRYLAENQDEREKWGEELHSWQKGAFERDLSELKEALDSEQITREEYLSGLQTLQNQYFEAGTEAWKAAEKKRQEEIASANRDAYDDQKADLDYFRDMDLVSEEEYYIQLAALRDNYLAEGSDAWRSATVAIHNYLEDRRKEETEAAEKAYQERLDALQKALDKETDALKKAYEAQKEAAKEAYEAQKEAAKAAYDAKKTQIKAELNLEKERLNAVIDGIDAEIQARKNLREDESQDDAISAAQKRLDAAKVQLSFARIDEDRAQWEREVVRLQEALDQAVQDKEDTAFYREKDAEKESVKEQISAAESAADKALAEAESNYNAKASKLEADYKSSLKRLEDKYNAAVSALERRYSSAESSSTGNAGANYSDKVRAIARANNVDLGVAQDMHEANQQAEAAGEAQRYSDGSAAKAAAASMARVVGAVADTVTRVVSRTTTNISKNANASVTINQASSLTSGQIDAAVQKVLNRLAR